MNNILINQNKPANIIKLAAQRQLYKRAKRFFILQVMLTVPVTIVLSLLKLIASESSGLYIVYTAALFGAAVSIADLLIGHFLVSEYRSKAAKIQEEFDCAVYEMDWNTISVGRKVDRETINTFSEKYELISGSPLEDWYPVEIANLPKEKAIYVCQKTNLHYDKSLRNKFITTVCMVCTAIFLIIFFCSIIMDATLTNFVFQVVLPFLPIFILTVKILIDHSKSIKASTELHRIISNLGEDNAFPEMQQLREIQTEIYRNRKNSPLVPDFFYNKKRKKLEKDMHLNAARD